MSAIENLFNKKHPEILYHYTTHTGFLGIAKSKILWCTSIIYLNDGKEYLHANELLVERLEYRIHCANNKQHRTDEADFLKKLQTGLDRIGIVMFFVGSFSENGDLLSQWRGYSRGGDGISLGFDSNRLKNLADKQGFQLVKCVYEPDEKRAIVDEFIDNYIRDQDRL